MSSTTSNFKVIPFAVSIPNENLLEMASVSGMTNTNGVVGTITFMGDKSVMVWVGWGMIEPSSDEEDTTQCTTAVASLNIDDEGSTKLIGTGVPTMGPLTVAMPRTKYIGMSSNDEAPCSQLIAGPNDEEMMMGWQMANRLSQKVGWPVFVSLSLVSSISSNGGGGGGGAMSDIGGIQEEMSSYETPIMAQRAASLAEKEIGKILMETKASLSI